MIVYSKSSGLNPAACGRLETPIKMIIEHESDLLTKKGGICSWLFNVEKSGKFGETIVGENEFSVFSAALEGAGAENDTVIETYRKFSARRFASCATPNCASSIISAVMVNSFINWMCSMNLR